MTDSRNSSNEDTKDRTNGDHTPAEKQANENPKIKRSEYRDHPEQYPTERESLFDLHESEQNVDPLPLEDIKIELREEKRKDQTKNSSSSDHKYKSGFEKKD